MRRTLLLVFLIVSLVVTSVAQQTKKPTFSGYPVTVEKARVRSIDFKNEPDARAFKTRLTQAIRGGVNFAGHYVVAGWGCGTGCISGAIIDARNGKVYWPLPLYALGVWYDGASYVEKPVEYRKNSRLLIIRGSPGVKDNDPEKPNGEYHYDWSGNELRLVQFFPYKAE